MNTQQRLQAIEFESMEFYMLKYRDLDSPIVRGIGY